MILIGLAIISFILNDFWSPSNGPQPDETELAIINGEPMLKLEFDQKVEEQVQLSEASGQKVTEEQREEIRLKVWENMVKQSLTKESFEELGIDVSEIELNYLITSENPHPMIIQYFGEAYSPQYVGQYLSFLKEEVPNEPEDRKVQRETEKQKWLFFTNQLVEEQKMGKYLTLVKKGLHISTFETTRQAEEKNNMINLKFFGEPYNNISDSAVTVTEAEIKKYYDENSFKYYRPYNERDIKYIVFDVIPSEQDIKATKEAITSWKEEFTESTDDAVTVNRYNPSDLQFTKTFYKQGEYPSPIDTFLFSGTKGQVFGPYEDRGAYVIAKISDIRDLPDTVKARHILVQDQSWELMEAKADSLLDLINNKKADFAAIAQQNSADEMTKMDGGNLGWITMNYIPSLAQMINNQISFVQPLVDSIFFGKPGTIIKVKTQIGIHIVEIQEKGKPVKKVLPAFLINPIVPGEETTEIAYQEANMFAGKNSTESKFDKTVAELGKDIRFKGNITETTKVIEGLEPGINQPREIVRWAFSENVSKGSISPVFEMKYKFIIAKLDAVREEGIQPLEEIKKDIEFRAKMEVKAKMLLDKFNKAIALGGTMEEIADTLNLTVNVAENVTLANGMIQGMNRELDVLAKSFNIAPDKMSKPIKGTNGVYVIQVTGKTTSPQAKPETEKVVIASENDRKVDQFLIEALKKAAEIKDYRIKYY